MNNTYLYNYNNNNIIIIIILSILTNFESKITIQYILVQYYYTSHKNSLCFQGSGSFSPDRTFGGFIINSINLTSFTPSPRFTNSANTDVFLARSCQKILMEKSSC